MLRKKLKRIEIFQYIFIGFDVLLSFLSVTASRETIYKLNSDNRIRFILDIFPAGWRIGRLADDKLVGEFSLSVAIICAIPFFISVFLYSFLQKSANEALTSYEAFSEENPARSTTLAMLFIAVPISLFFFEAGIGFSFGFLSGRGFASDGGAVFRAFYGASGFRLGVACAVYALSSACLYGVALFALIKTIMVLVLDEFKNH
jgi:hypothetical protein